MTPATGTITMTDFIESQKTRIDAILQKKFEQGSSVADWPPKLRESIQYSLFAGGKRLRPVLALTVVELLGRDPARYDNLYVALECIHTYSLIHDDLPAMDNDQMRRGMPTNHVKFGEATAILAGDALLTYAFELLAEDTFARRFEAQNVVRCIHQIAAAAGPSGMVGGQMIDTCGFSGTPKESDLERLHILKTAKLLSVSVTSPVLIDPPRNDSDNTVLNKLARYGDAIGLAFQICDDILNVEGSAAQMGKAVGSDAELGKMTYPRLVGLDTARARAKDLCMKAKSSLDGFPSSRCYPLELLANFIIERVK